MYTGTLYQKMGNIELIPLGEFKDAPEDETFTAGMDEVIRTAHLPECINQAGTGIPRMAVSNLQDLITVMSDISDITVAELNLGITKVDKDIFFFYTSSKGHLFEFVAKLD